MVRACLAKSSIVLRSYDEAFEIVRYCVVFETILVLRRCGLSDDLIHAILAKYLKTFLPKGLMLERHKYKATGLIALQIWCREATKMIIPLIKFDKVTFDKATPAVSVSRMINDYPKPDEIIRYCVVFETILVLKRCRLSDDLILMILDIYLDAIMSESKDRIERLYKERHKLKENGQTVLDMWYIYTWIPDEKKSCWMTRTEFDKRGGEYRIEEWPALL
jgi:hypothetical protein